MINQELMQSFHRGDCLNAYDLFGAHLVTENGVEGVRFTVYAPNAAQIYVVGEFNEWKNTTPMYPLVENASIWSCFVPGLKQFDMYKYRIHKQFGRVDEHCDPYAFFSELRPGTASKVYELDGYEWNDQAYLKTRTRNYDAPMNIYEMHLGSWKLKEVDEDAKEGEQFYSYVEMADLIIPYVKNMGYTHIELMPLSEHPFDGSWGYQVTGYFSATSRYGEPKQLMEFVDKCHQAGIGIIMDFVPAHFVKDSFGLYEFDGSCLYGYPDWNRRYSEWDTVYFDLGREEVRSFMMSAADFWLTKYHIDGIRFDAVSNLIFWKGNKGAGLNDGAVDFMKRMNYLLHKKHPTIMTIAEDSSDYGNVTRDTLEGGLGFDYKWDLGWMNDTLKYMGYDPVYRQYHHGLMTFSMAYFYSERFILPFSHDEVVHSKGTIIDKIHGDFDQKFRQLRSLYVYMMSHPGKKLNFMGNELGEFKEWDEKKALGWNILTFPAHDAFHHYIKDLNGLYLMFPAFYQADYHWAGFKWLIVDDNQQSLFAYQRKDMLGNVMIYVMNFTPNVHNGLRIPVEVPGIYKELLNTDRDIYGGSNVTNPSHLHSEEVPWVREEDSIVINLGAFASSVIVLERRVTKKVKPVDGEITFESTTLKAVKKAEAAKKTTAKKATTKKTTAKKETKKAEPKKTTKKEK